MKWKSVLNSDVWEEGRAFMYTILFLLSCCTALHSIQKLSTYLCHSCTLHLSLSCRLAKLTLCLPSLPPLLCMPLSCTSFFTFAPSCLSLLLPCKAQKNDRFSNGRRTVLAHRTGYKLSAWRLSGMPWHLPHAALFHALG